MKRQTESPPEKEKDQTGVKSQSRTLFAISLGAVSPPSLPSHSTHFHLALLRHLNPTLPFTPLGPPPCYPRGAPGSPFSGQTRAIWALGGRRGGKGEGKRGERGKITKKATSKVRPPATLQTGKKSHAYGGAGRDLHESCAGCARGDWCEDFFPRKMKQYEVEDCQ